MVVRGRTQKIDIMYIYNPMVETISWYKLTAIDQSLLLIVPDFKISYVPVPVTDEAGIVGSVLNSGMMVSFIKPNLLISDVSMIPKIGRSCTKVSMFFCINDDSCHEISLSSC